MRISPKENELLLSFSVIAKGISASYEIIFNPCKTVGYCVLVSVRLLWKGHHGHHGHGSSYRGKHWIGAGLEFRGNPLWSWREACQYTGRHDAGERKETESMGLAWASETSEPALSDTLSPTRPRLLIVPRPMGLGPGGPFSSKPLHSVR